MKMKKIILIFLLFTFYFNSAFSQQSIKKVIYEDLLLLNNLYDGCIIQFEQKKYLIKGTDTKKDNRTLNDLKDDFENRVIITRIDSFNNFYSVVVRFNLIPNSRYKGLFDDNVFRYVLYKQQHNFLKINGFFTSDILRIKENPLVSSKVISSNGFKKLSKYLKKRNVDKIKNYLSISILEILKNSGYEFYYRPYVKEILCF